VVGEPADALALRDEVDQLGLLPVVEDGDAADTALSGHGLHDGEGGVAADHRDELAAGRLEAHQLLHRLLLELLLLLDELPEVALLVPAVLAEVMDDVADHVLTVDSGHREATRNRAVSLQRSRRS
jgi:hypothetical protein